MLHLPNRSAWLQPCFKRALKNWLFPQVLHQNNVGMIFEIEVIYCVYFLHCCDHFIFIILILVFFIVLILYKPPRVIAKQMP